MRKMTEFLPNVPRVVHFVIAAPCVIKVIYSMQHIVLINVRDKKSLFQVFFYVSWVGSFTFPLSVSK